MLIYITNKTVNKTKTKLGTLENVKKSRCLKVWSSKVNKSQHVGDNPEFHHEGHFSCEQNYVFYELQTRITQNFVVIFWWKRQIFCYLHLQIYPLSGVFKLENRIGMQCSPPLVQI